MKNTETSSAQAFENYLKRKGHSRKTRATYTAQLNHYLQWLESQQIAIIESRNTDVLAYMKYCSTKGNAQKTIQCRLGSISHYYNYLKKEGIIAHDPIMGIEVKGIKRHRLYQPLAPHELNNLYHKYPSDTPTRKRNKVILGLVVYQGLRTGELSKLTTKDINIREAEIYIIRSRKCNERTLKLESHQVLDLYDYLLQVRPTLTKGKEIEQLFFNRSGSSRFSIIIHPIVKWLKGNHKIESLNQIRASVITKWLKMYNLREAQYLAGHRYISSTERYLQNDMEGLKEEIQQYHPLG